MLTHSSINNITNYIYNFVEKSCRKIVFTLLGLNWKVLRELNCKKIDKKPFLCECNLGQVYIQPFHSVGVALFANKIFDVVNCTLRFLYIYRQKKSVCDNLFSQFSKGSRKWWQLYRSQSLETVIVFAELFGLGN